MEIVITMAGLGSRFTKAGYKVPKYMIPAKGKSLFEWSMESLEGFGDDNTYYLIVRGEDGADDFLEEACKKAGIRDHRLITLPAPTDGQATTARLAATFWDPDKPLLIYNIDTYVESGAMNAGQIDGDGWIPCFRAPGDHWSFVKLDEKGWATEVTEKVRISDHCTLGAYYFKSCALYEELYREFYEEGRCAGLTGAAGKERYVAPLYNYLISKGGHVTVTDVPEEKVHVLGTPEELQVFLNEA
ncbi:MAG: glycosyltransferase family 2 protein [Lachnospiraceae bacterium]|nr:glycosyltransferase family 2 protein [Lachnospiraceae bacterium]